MRRSGVMLAGLTALSMTVLAQSAAAQVAVNITADIPGTTFHAEDIAQFIQQVAQLKLTVQQLSSTYNALTGTRGMGDLFSTAGLANTLPSNWQGVYSSLANGGYSGISGSATSIINSEQSAVTSGTTTDAFASVQARQGQKAAYDKAMAQSAYTAEMDRLNAIESLTAQINQTQDPKAVADLQARLQAEQLRIQEEQTKLQLMAMLQNAEQNLIEQQKSTLDDRVFNSNNTGMADIGSGQ